MVSGIGGSYQPNVGSTFQQNLGSHDNRVGTSEQRPRTNQVQPRQAPTASAQRSNEQQLLTKKEEAASEGSRADNAANLRISENEQRGSLLDITA